MTRKSGMAEEERSQRDYRETYGRGGGESFEDREYPQSYGAPGSMAWRDALRAYVDGHDRGWGAGRKEREAARKGAAAGPAGGVGSGAAAAAEAGAVGAPEVVAPAPEDARVGVSVPDREELDFHRGASVWRDRLPVPRPPIRRPGGGPDAASDRGGRG